MKLNKILVPTDFSPAAINALEYAGHLAKKMNAELHVLHVMDVPEYLFEENTLGVKLQSIEDFLSDLQKEETKKLDEFLANLQEIKVHKYTKPGSPLVTIEKVVEEIEADLIVMGTKGITGMSEMVIGSNTEKIVRKSNIPVITINEKTTDFNLQTIVIAIDDYEVIPGGLQLLLALAKAVSAKLYLLRVCTPQHFETSHEAKVKMLKFAELNNIAEYESAQYNFHTIEEGIFHFAKEVSADVIGLGTHGRRGLAHLFFGSKTEDIVNHSLLPIFTYKIS